MASEEEPRAHRHPVLAAVGAVVALVVLALVLRLVFRQGDLLALPAVALVAVPWLLLVAGWLATWLLTRAAPPLLAAGRRLASAAWSGLSAEPEARWLAARWRVLRRQLAPLRPAWRWLAARLAPDRAGLGRTLPVVVIVAAVVGLVAIDRALASSPATLPAIDRRYAELATRLQTEPMHSFMAALSEVGSTTGIIVLLAVLALGAVLARARVAAVLLLATSALTALAVTVLKEVVGRARPPVGTIVETTYSWPSGHSSGGLALAAGICVMLAWAGVRHWRWFAGVVLPLGLLIGYGRAYLTVHWPSDVAAGWLMAVAVTALVVLVANLRPRWAQPRPGRMRWLAVAAVAALAIATVRGVAGTERAYPEAPARQVQAVPDVEAVFAFLRDDPFSRTLLGRTMEPVSVVVVADRPTLDNAIRAAGWTVVDGPTLPRLVAAYRAGASGQPDPSAPLAPAFLNTRMQDLSLQQQPPGRGEQVQHHARLWRLPLQLPDGCGAWTATASRDDRAEWTWRLFVPRHGLHPALDLEREHLADSLAGTGILERIATHPLLEPTYAVTAAGDPFFTDGDVAVLRQEAPCSPSEE